MGFYMTAKNAIIEPKTAMVYLMLLIEYQQVTDIKKKHLQKKMLHRAYLLTTIEPLQKVLGWLSDSLSGTTCTKS